MWSHDYPVLLIFVLAYYFSALMCFFWGLGKLLHKHIHIIQLEGITTVSLILDVTATGFLYLQQNTLFRHYYQWNRFEDFAVAYCNFCDICCFNLNLNSASLTLFPVTLENQAFSVSSSAAALMPLPPASFLCLWICLEFPVDRVSRVPSFSPSLACVATIFPERGCKECLSPEHSGMKALGRYKRVFVISALDFATWPLPPFVLLFQSLQCDPQLTEDC